MLAAHRSMFMLTQNSKCIVCFQLGGDKLSLKEMLFGVRSGEMRSAGCKLTVRLCVAVEGQGK